MILTRIAAAVAALFLIAASVLGGALAANATPTDPPVIVTPTGPGFVPSPVIEGTTTQNGLRVQIYANGVLYQTCDTPDQTFYCPSPGTALPYGNITFEARAQFFTGFPDSDWTPLGAPVTYTLGGTQSTTIDSPVDGAVTPDATPTFTGTGPSMGRVSVTDGGFEYCTADVDAAGNWSCTVTAPLAADIYPYLSAVATLVDGSPGTGSTTQTLTVVPPPAPTLQQTFTPWVTSSAAPGMIQGTKDADVSYLQVYASTTPTGVGNPYCQATGTIGATVWYCDAPLGTLSLGNNYLYAIASNEGGAFSAQSSRIAVERVPVPVLLAPGDGAFVNTPNPSLSGQSASGSTATIYDQWGAAYCSSAIVAGEFECQATGLADDTYTWFADVTPGSFISSAARTFTVDTVVTDPVITGPATTTTSTRPVITGTSEPFSTIVVYRDGAPAACDEGIITADAAGNWSCTSTATLGVGNTFDFGAKQIDRAGNDSSPGVPPVQRSVTIVPLTTVREFVLVSPDFIYVSVFGGVPVVPPTDGVDLPSDDGLSIQRFDFDTATGTATFAESCIYGETAASPLLFRDSVDEGFGGVYFFPCSTGAGPGPGVTQVRIAQKLGGTTQFLPFDYILEPVAPTDPVVQLNDDGTVTVSGEGLAPGEGEYATGSGETATSYGVSIWDGTEYAAPLMCDAVDNPVGDDGTWSCTFEAPGPGVHTFSVAQKWLTNWDPAFATVTPYSALSTAVSAAPVTIVEPAPPPAAPAQGVTPGSTPPPAPTVPPLTQQQPWTFSFSAGGSQVAPGDRILLTGTGPLGAAVDVELRSTPVHLGTTTVRPDATFSLLVTVPENAAPGPHEFVVVMTAPDGTTSTQRQPVTVVLPERGAASAARETLAEARTPAGTGSTVPRTDAAAPSAITDALPTLRDIIRSPLTLAVAGGLAVLILLLVALPTEVLNSTLESNTGRFGRAFNTVQAAGNRAAAWFDRVTGTPMVAAGILIVLTSVTFGFVDPAFGFDLVSLRLVLSLALALFVLTVVIPIITGAIVRRVWSVGSTITMQPVALIFAVVGVVLARVLDFSPGFLIGLVVGLELAERASKRVQVRATAIEFSAIIITAVLAWVGYSLLADSSTEDSGFGIALLQDTLVAITAEGLVAVLVALLPVGFLDGRTLFRRARRLWVALFVVAGFAFAVIVLPTAMQVQEMSNIGWWLVVLVAYAALAFGLTIALKIGSTDEDDDDRPGTSHELAPAGNSVP